MEEKLRALEASRAELQSGAPHPGAKPAKPARGRWLERLGLKDGEK
jgi:hypothetical protein